jgi:hypothetical protein
MPPPLPLPPHPIIPTNIASAKKPNGAALHKMWLPGSTRRFELRQPLNIRIKNIPKIAATAAIASWTATIGRTRQGFQSSADEAAVVETVKTEVALVVVELNVTEF